VRFPSHAVLLCAPCSTFVVGGCILYCYYCGSCGVSRSPFEAASTGVRACTGETDTSFTAACCKKS
jgi:hypothetical protein